MTIREQILDDIKVAMKEKDEFKRDTLRTLNAALKQVEVDNRVELTDDVVLPLLQKEIKKRNDAKELFLKGEREDLAQKEQNEMDIISKYLPAQLSDDELKDKLREIITEVGACSIAKLGDVIKTAKERLGASADPKRISDMAKKFLA
ncbi:GatB/YqeY domain-containing protein [Campylobacter pinnipediorum]|uniref:GatB/YqeY domain-containing protein n=1 Tax=Campylobacter pinnipediorum TaxID=1965231 RepID=UPI00084DC261|nr:GatB/YqeY domain-containing protein [Campylobacter pinnipediorum]AQW81553.1 putative protein GatB/YqeY family protein [Campylobacter pinnipediorum subsp. pinnipediorum]AQW83181.1 putative protein GatB/YqeY family protein [Campylobacter pinnipediorum subsp. pinnipediorum]AQW84749.1 putative protein GatB/YqeY family protein [Campylobacter pinnipediorum subsp. pinnipediorum]